MSHVRYVGDKIIIRRKKTNRFGIPTVTPPNDTPPTSGPTAMRSLIIPRERDNITIAFDDPNRRVSFFSLDSHTVRIDRFLFSGAGRVSL